MPYPRTIRREAQSITRYSTEDTLYPIYNGILNRWFSPRFRYLVCPQVRDHGRPDFTVARRSGTQFRNTVIVVELKRPGRWTDRGKEEVKTQLTEYVTDHFGHTQHNIIFALAGIGLRWKLYRARRPRGNQLVQLTVVHDWQNDITTQASYMMFAGIAQDVHNLGPT